MKARAIAEKPVFQIWYSDLYLLLYILRAKHEILDNLNKNLQIIFANVLFLDRIQARIETVLLEYGSASHIILIYMTA
jgi:hypothetical protein